MMSKRSTRQQTAQETVAILERGWYESPTGRRVSLQDALDVARSGSVLYTPEQFRKVAMRRDHLLEGKGDAPTPTFAVVNETTLSAARRLLAEEAGSRPLALNFASAKNPGGGFLNGSQAQEESLARASGLYACIAPMRQMYEANRSFPSCLYTDHMIYSPDVPVFRDDEDALLERPYAVSFVTAPAVNVGALRRNELEKLPQVEPVMLARMEKVLSLAVVHGHDVLVLGAWGCGVFDNDPMRVADWFARWMTGGGHFRRAFRRVVFAVWDRSTDGATLHAFERVFAQSA
jgi:uncharacterized protein (TIGR02452 family)